MTQLVAEEFNSELLLPTRTRVLLEAPDACPLRILRDYRALTRDQLGYLAAVAPQDIDSIEAHGEGADPDKLRKLARALRVPPDLLLRPREHAATRSARASNASSTHELVSLDRPGDIRVPSSPGRQAVVVTGMHRSGTSALSRLMSHLGCAQPSDLMAPQPDNPEGFWESQGVADLNDEILLAMNMSWDAVGAPILRKLSIEESWRLLSRDIRAKFRKRAVDALNKAYPEQALVVLKDPRISLLPDFWNEAIEEAGFSPTYVLIFRNPLEVVRSLRVRNGLPDWLGQALWAKYNLSILRSGLADHCLSFESLVENAQQAVSKMTRQLGCLEHGDLNAAVACVHPELRHHAYRREDVHGQAFVPDIVQRLYGYLLRCEAGVGVEDRIVAELSSQLEQHILFMGAAVPVERRPISLPVGLACSV